MDKALVLKKLEALSTCIGRIESKRPAEPGVLRQDRDLQDIITINLERAVHVCADVATHLIADTARRSPETMSECFAELRSMGVLSEALATRLQKAVGFRNIAVHEYQEIDWDVVFSIITKHIGDFRAYAAAVLAYCGLARE